jgi:hypothetical protein
MAGFASWLIGEVVGQRDDFFDLGWGEEAFDGVSSWG